MPLLDLDTAIVAMRTAMLAKKHGYALVFSDRTSRVNVSNGAGSFLCTPAERPVLENILACKEHILRAKEDAA